MNALTVVAISAGAVLEGVLFVFFFEGQSVSKMITIHAAAVLLMWCGFYFQNGRRDQRHGFRPVHFFILSFMLFFPAAGLFLGGILYLLAVEMSRFLKSRIYDQYEEYLHEKSELGAFARASSSLALGLRQMRESVGFEPYADIMKGALVKSKLRAIDKLRKQLNKNSVGLLKQAIRDQSPEIRLYAANALLSLDREISEKIQLAREAAEHQGSASAYARLADLYRTYVKTGLAESSLCSKYLQQSVEAYQKSLDIETDQTLTIVSYGRSLVDLGEYEKAKILADRAMRLWPDHSEIVFLCNEIYFHLGLFSQIPVHFQRLNPEVLDKESKEVVLFWMPSL